MKIFLDDNFLLESATAEKLYHDYAKEMPILDYHNHLSPQQIADDVNFENLAAAWLHGDHYKWRAMRANGVNEKFCTGNASDWGKFEQWAATVPYTMRNPLYHWTHLELQRYFDIHEQLSPATARKIYDECSAKLQSKDWSVRNLLRKMNVKYVGTTDDPLDDLTAHQKIIKDGFEIKVNPSFRPDKTMNIDNAVSFNEYVTRLEAVIGKTITGYDDYIAAIKSRHDYFAANGCTVSDHGLEKMYAEDYTGQQLKSIFENVRKGNNPEKADAAKFKSAMLVYFAEWGFEKNWVQQYHMGPIRNNNSRMFDIMGADTGWDSMGGSVNIAAIAKFLNRLDKNKKLAKTILYSINPADNDMLATMAGNFNDGSFPGKIQLGAAWWFNDQQDGIIQHLKSVSNMGLLSRFIGMLTDSRSFLSFPRHEYFRRILCNLLGSEIENGQLPNDIDWIGKVIQDICFNNAKNYFNWHHIEEQASSIVKD